MTDEEICKRILNWQARTPFWKCWLYWNLLGMDYCPCCDRPTRWRFDGRNPIHPEGPPLVCRRCNHPFLEDAHDLRRGA
jgi:hypothetical protein